MLYWLAENRRDDSAEVWKLLRVQNPSKAYREPFR
jgi:hypothetical protein